MISIRKTPNHTLVYFERSLDLLSSAILNGGLISASQWLNLKVTGCNQVQELPQQTLQNYCDNLGLTGVSVGMMTAASMNSLRHFARCEQGISIGVILTAGLANRRRAGDAADINSMFEPVRKLGTINMLVYTSAKLTTAAMAEVLMLATEAKSACLQSLGILSPVSGLVATGTGTDSIAIASDPFGVAMKYCGKHTRFGELVGSLVQQALLSSIKRQPEGALALNAGANQ